MSLSSRVHIDPPLDGISSTPAFGLTVHGPLDSTRNSVEAFIREIYARRYGAQVLDFAPILVGLSENGELLAAAGYRSAGDESLFLERYLPAPVDALLAARAHGWPARERIAEVGHLAAVRSGEGRRLIQLLGPHLAGEGFEWVVGTVTQELRKMLMRLGIVPLTLGTADPAALGDEAGHWGSYYEHQPVVLAGRLGRTRRHHGGRRSSTPEAGE